MKILIADDDPQILRALSITLTAKGYEVFTAQDGAAAVSMAVDHQPDIYLLDLGMPKMDGMTVIQGIRGWTAAPILVVSGRTGAADKVEALDVGADDYVTKPFSIEELLARIRALTRRAPQHEPDPVVAFGGVLVDLASHSVTRIDGGETHNVRLTPTEWHVLELLLRNPGKLVTRQTLLSSIWGTDHVSDSGYLRLYIAQLRKKLERNPSEPVHILTEAGMGYRLQLDADPAEPRAAAIT
ncbi:response regulator transcription factor [Leucobacter coleopterorum]|uniref:Response regulator transcription factor n=1 Tax=Leucobacter coleopterorum TaxID=2714933 RepID=A0ABX6JZ55_9MICO|nr:response regulator transcription factor [Leucobacter coleopterorum]QIM19603.1 response regulator transcription factor [Leucobacter coleopterorum]